MRILITGATGQLGSAMAARFAAGHDVLPLGASQLDVRHHEAVLDAVRGAAPDVVVNCAAYNDVDGAESHPQDALDVNAFAVRSLAAAAASAGALLVHYGTDFVFDGRADRPYTEEDRPNPRSVYASSKLLGEWFARDAPRHLVLRVESLFGGVSDVAGRRSSIDRIADLVLAGQEARVFTDRTVSPSYTADVIDATRTLIESGAEPGLYHCVNSGSCTWHELALEIAACLGVKPCLLPIAMSEARLQANRPRYCVLSNARLARAGFVMPTWQDAIARYLRVRAS